MRRKASGPKSIDPLASACPEDRGPAKWVPLVTIGYPTFMSPLPLNS